jgi:hypothetical protein
MGHLLTTLLSVHNGSSVTSEPIICGTVTWNNTYNTHRITMATAKIVLPIYYNTKQYILGEQRSSLYRIWDFHGGDYEECHLLGCGAVWVLWEPTFRRKTYALLRNVGSRKTYTSPHPRRRHSSAHFTLRNLQLNIFRTPFLSGGRLLYHQPKMRHVLTTMGPL